MFDNELTSQQAADRLGVSRPFVTKHVRPYRMVGNRYRYLVDQVDAFAETLRPDGGDS